MITIFSVFWFNEINSFVTVFLLKEIDAITAPQPTAPVGASAPPPTPPRPEPKESTSALSSTTPNGTDSAQTAGWQYDTQCSLAGGELGPLNFKKLQSIGPVMALQK